MAGLFKKKKEEVKEVKTEVVKVEQKAVKKIDKKPEEKIEKPKATKEVAKPKKVAPKKASSKTTAKVSNSNFESILLTPRITEKASDIQMDHNAYTFNVISSAGKNEIAQAIEAVYGVKPLKIRIVKVPSKTVVTRKGKRGMKSGGKKAYVYLKKDDSIEFV